MSKRAEEAAWKWATENKLDPYSMGRAYGEGFEHAEKDTLDYACYKLELRLPEYLNYNGVQVERAEFIKDFRKAMEEE